ncbi:hypothetical protein M9458_056140 [Cirrhinus mrigala]|uniref:Uncharacterized protein n=1 Tax=Cirrhinus mrigala TaxID=683832 RepID=A0ABD0MK67_CIRMR
MSICIVPPGTAKERQALQQAVASLRQQGRDGRSFAQFFWTMARGLEYPDSTLKEAFNLCLDDPIPQWEQLRILDYWNISNYLHHRKDWQILTPPEVACRDPATLPLSLSQIQEPLLTPTLKRRLRRRAAKTAGSARESAPVSAPVHKSAPVSAPAHDPRSLSDSKEAQVEKEESSPEHRISQSRASRACSRQFRASQVHTIHSRAGEPTHVTAESVETTQAFLESVKSAQVLPVLLKVSSVIPEEKVAVIPEAANHALLSPQKQKKRRAHIVQSNTLLSEVPSTMVQQGLNPEFSDPLAQEGPSQVPPSSVVLVQEDQSLESSNPLVTNPVFSVMAFESSSRVMTTETDPASHATSSEAAPALVTEAISGRLDLPAIATEATPELLTSHDSPKEIISTRLMSSEVISASQNTVKKSVSAPALHTSSRSDGASETLHDVTLVHESTKLFSLPTNSVMAPAFVPNPFPNQETASVRRSKPSWEFPPVKRAPFSRGVHLSVGYLRGPS